MTLLWSHWEEWDGRAPVYVSARTFGQNCDGFNLGSHLVDLRGRAVIDEGLAVVPRLAAVVAPTAEVALIFAPPALGTVRTSHSTVVHLNWNRTDRKRERR